MVLRNMPVHILKRMAFACFAFVAMLLASTPAFAQMDLVGEWANLFHEDQPERLGGPDIGDYAGLPINDAARMAAESWNADILSVPEHQCKPHPADYSPRGPAMLQIWKDVDPVSRQVIALRTHISWQAPERWIYMDGRPHPDLARFTPSMYGHSTGRYEGNALIVETVGLTAGTVQGGGRRRPETRLIERFDLTPDGKRLTITYTWDDPLIYVRPHSYKYEFERLPEDSYAFETWCDSNDPLQKYSIVPPKQ